jgi:peptidoglycan/xylan/chitin deacetylase (PgdA/CDA1 family)
MRWLAEHGYSAVTLNQVDRAWFHDGTLPRKPIVVSMDDGYRGQYVYGLPELKKLGWPADLNLLVHSLASGGELDDRQVKAMIDAGWEIDAHTVDHLDVSTLTGHDLSYEVAGSRRILRKRFGVPVDFFCYPAGSYDAEAIRAVKRAGFEGATTENAGLASKNQMYTLNRIRIELDDGVSGLAAKLAHPAAFSSGKTGH